MSLRRTALLAVAVILVGGFYYFYEIEGAKRRNAAEEQRQRLFEVEPGDVSAVRLERQGLKLGAVRRDGVWRLISPLETRADQEAVQELVRSTSRAKRIRLIDEKPSGLKPFGLEEPRILITLETAEGRHRLAVGSASPTGRGVYARAAPDGAVVLLERDAERAAEKGLLEFRERSIFSSKAEEVEGLSLLLGSDKILLRKTAERNWALQEPVEAPADPLAVGDLIRALTQGEVQEFIDNPTEDESLYGLASPRAEVTLYTVGGLTLGPLRIGKSAETDGRVYARLGKTGPVLLLKEELLEALPDGAADLRERRLLVYELKDVERLEAASPEETVVLERRGERDWTIREPAEAAADDSAVRNFLWDLKALRAEEFLDGADPAEARFGLEPAGARYMLKLEGRPEPLWLEIGGRAEGVDRYVRASGLKGLATVAADGLEKIEVTRLTFMERSLLPFETEEVRRLEMTAFGRHIELRKDGSAWMLKEPEERELKAGAVTSLLWSLKRLKFSGVLEEERKGEPAGEVLLEARLWLDSGKLSRLSVVRPEGEGAPELLAFGSARPGLYKMESEDLGEVTEELERF